jgi:hypothetical protein
VTACIFSAASRITMSLGPPGGKGSTTRTGLSGQAACASDGQGGGQQGGGQQVRRIGFVMGYPGWWPGSAMIAQAAHLGAPYMSAPPAPVSTQAARAGRRTAAAVSLQWRHRGDPSALWQALRALHQPGAVIGIGAPLADAVGPWLSPGCARSSACSAAASRCRRRRPMSGRWCPGTTPARCSNWPTRWSPRWPRYAALVRATPLFDYRQGTT